MTFLSCSGDATLGGDGQALRGREAMGSEALELLDELLERRLLPSAAFDGVEKGSKERELQADGG
jgi:hypothetical protein